MKYTFLFIVILCAWSTSISQTRNLQTRSMLMDYGDRFYADTYVVPSSRADTAEVFVFFRLANDFLSFTKNTDRTDLGGNYRSDIVVSIELRDSLGVIRKRIRWTDTAYTNKYEETNSKTTFHYGYTSATIGSGVYYISLDIISAKESAQKRIKLPAVEFNPNKTTRQLAPPMFAEIIMKNGEELLRPYIFSSNIPFTGNDAMMLLLVGDTANTKYTYSITQRPYDPQDIRWWQIDTTIGEVTSRKDRFPRIAQSSTSKGMYIEMHEAEATARRFATIDLLIPVTALVPGKYNVKLTRVGSTDTISITFALQWELMPMSLRNLNYAYNVMKYILTDEQLDSIDRGDDTERRLHLMNWWKTQDPSPGTTYNERMAEYFRRVDYAITGFNSIPEPDGALSERGKVYILYGSPTSIEKSLSPKNQPMEIWKYTTGVKKTFTFQSNESGVFKLLSIENL